MVGTAFRNIDQSLGGSPAYIAFRNGETSPQAYQQWIEREGFRTMGALNEDQINLSARFPRETKTFMRQALSQCKNHDITIHDDLENDDTDKILTQVASEFDHGSYLTYIFPEEFAFLYAIVKIARPRRAAFMGSFYGYWAMAARLANKEMEMTLLDVSRTVMDVAQRNFQNFGLERKTQFVVADAEAFISRLKDVDLLVLDAEGPKSEDMPPDYRDKAIYYPHLKAAFDYLAPGALLVAHNVILANFTGSSYFEAKQQSYRSQYTKFLPFVREHFVYTIIDSTEGMLVGRKR
jgi:predicted O-methyltransferase YrrM